MSEKLSDWLAEWWPFPFSNYGTGNDAVTRAKALEAKLMAMERLKAAVQELLEVARLRGDTDLPHPADDPKHWTARMQTAWDDLAAAQEEEGHGLDKR